MQSRYYDPVIHRFINADAFASTGQGILGCNMFAYSVNNPLHFSDSNGYYAQAVMMTDAGVASEEHRERMKKLCAKVKYNRYSVNLYSLNSSNVNGEDNISGRVNISFYYPDDPSDSNIRIWNSYEITDYYEMEAIIEVMMESELYDSELFTNTKQQYITEWQAHNHVYEINSRGHRSFVDDWIIDKTQHVDFGASDWIWGIF